REPEGSTGGDRQRQEQLQRERGLERQHGEQQRRRVKEARDGLARERHAQALPRPPLWNAAGVQLGPDVVLQRNEEAREVAVERQLSAQQAAGENELHSDDRQQRRSRLPRAAARERGRHRVTADRSTRGRPWSRLLRAAAAA